MSKIENSKKLSQQKFNILYNKLNFLLKEIKYNKLNFLFKEDYLFLFTNSSSSLISI
jgi:hypothetical protein